jgi:hypothetical protein
MKYPLLIQGINGNTSGTISTLNPGVLAAPITWTNQLKVGRGDLVGVDPVLVATDATISQLAGTFTYSMAGTQIFNNADNSRHVVGARPGNYNMVAVRQGGGQTVALTFANNATVPCGMVVHHYYENLFFVQQVIEAANYAQAKQRVQDFSFVATTVGKFIQSPNFTIPTALGNVVAVEFIVTGTTAAATFAQITKALITVSIGGTTILENASGGIFTPASARPGLIFPLVIRGGETFQFLLDTSALAATSQVNLTMRCYFDNDLSGSKMYL